MKNLIFVIFFTLLNAISFSKNSFGFDALKKLKSLKVCRNCNMVGVDLRGAVLKKADLKGSNLSGAKLIGVNLQGAKLEKAYLQTTDLTGANLISSDLQKVYLKLI